MRGKFSCSRFVPNMRAKNNSILCDCPPLYIAYFKVMITVVYNPYLEMKILHLTFK